MMADAIYIYEYRLYMATMVEIRLFTFFLLNACMFLESFLSSTEILLQRRGGKGVFVRVFLYSYFFSSQWSELHRTLVSRGRGKYVHSSAQQALDLSLTGVFPANCAI